MCNKKEVIKTLRDYIPILESGIEDFVNKNYSGQEEWFLKDVYSIVEGIEWVINAIVLTTNLHSIDLDIDEINESLAEILDGMKNGDHILITDILQYEILVRLSSWRIMIADN